MVWQYNCRINRMTNFRTPSNISKNYFMNKYHIFMATAAWLIAMSAATALDTIKTKTSGFLGKIVDTSPLKVELQLSNSRKEIPVNQIETIFYDNEPGLLKNAKLAILARRYDDGLNPLFRLKIEEISREEIREDMEFYTALATAQLAIARSDKVAD